VIRPQKRREYPPARPLSNWAIWLGAVIVLAIAVTAWVVLLRRYGGTGAGIELDAIRTAGALVVGTGGAFALLLAARRQRSTELTLVHTEHDGPNGGSPNCTPRPPTNSAATRPRSAWPGSTPWSGWRTAPPSTAKPSWT